MPVRNKNLTRGLKNLETALGSPAACRGGGGPLIRDAGQYLNFTPFGCLLRSFLWALAARPGPDSLSLRGYRDRLNDRFTRWFSDLLGGDALELLRVMDPRLATVPLVLRGEGGTGRALFARYVHTFGGDAAGGNAPFIAIDCANLETETELLVLSQR